MPRLCSDGTRSYLKAETKREQFRAPPTPPYDQINITNVHLPPNNPPGLEIPRIGRYEITFANHQSCNLKAPRVFCSPQNLFSFYIVHLKGIHELILSQ